MLFWSDLGTMVFKFIYLFISLPSVACNVMGWAAILDDSLLWFFHTLQDLRMVEREAFIIPFFLSVGCAISDLRVVLLEQQKFARTVGMSACRAGIHSPIWLLFKFRIKIQENSPIWCRRVINLSSSFRPGDHLSDAAVMCLHYTR